MWLHYFQVNTRLFKVPIHIDNGPAVTLALSLVTGPGQTFNYTNKDQRNRKTSKLKTQTQAWIRSWSNLRRLFIRLAYIAFPVPETDMCCVLSRLVRCTCAQSVHIILDERFQRPDDWGLNRRCLGPPEYARWGINYWLLNGFMDTHYTWKVCRIKVFMWRWVRFGGRHIETLFIDS